MTKQAYITQLMKLQSRKILSERVLLCGKCYSCLNSCLHLKLNIGILILRLSDNLGWSVTFGTDSSLEGYMIDSENYTADL